MAHYAENFKIQSMSGCLEACYVSRKIKKIQFLEIEFVVKFIRKHQFNPILLLIIINLYWKFEQLQHR